MALIPTFLLFICPLAAFLLLVRLLCAPFSAQVSDQMRKYPGVHLVWGCFAFVGALVFVGALNPGVWPPPSIERRAQRKQVGERAAKAGGWDAVRRGCESLVTNYPDGLQWFPPRRGAWVYPNPTTQPHRYYVTNLDYGPLPAAVAALQPREVRFYPLQVLREMKSEPQIPVVRIKLFGMHSTGGHSTPYYGLEVPCGPGAETYEPTPSHGGVSGNRYSSFRKVADGVFEIY